MFMCPGRKNETGMKVQCPNKNCGYVWLTNSEQAITSCPKCGFRTRLRRNTRINQNPGNFSSETTLPEQQAPKRYY